MTWAAGRISWGHPQRVPTMSESTHVQRLNFPDEEGALSWLTPLLDAYHVADRGVAEAIRRERQRGKILACKKGCAACCRTQAATPIYPLELMGLTWFVTEKTEGSTRSKLLSQLRAHRQGQPCPLLVDGACSVHPMRPMACRHFNVFGKPCAEGEDVSYLRRADVLAPIRQYQDEAMITMLSFYGVERRTERRKLVKSGAAHQMARALQECNWEAVAERMTSYERRAGADTASGSAETP